MNRRYLSEMGLNALREQVSDPSKYADGFPKDMDPRLGAPSMDSVGDPSKQGKVSYGMGDSLGANYIGSRGKTFKPSRPGQSPRGGTAEYRMTKFQALGMPVPKTRPIPPSTRSGTKGFLSSLSNLFGRK